MMTGEVVGKPAKRKRWSWSAIIQAAVAAMVVVFIAWVILANYMAEKQCHLAHEAFASCFRVGVMQEQFYDATGAYAGSLSQLLSSAATAGFDAEWLSQLAGTDCDGYRFFVHRLPGAGEGYLVVGVEKGTYVFTPPAERVVWVLSANRMEKSIYVAFLTTTEPERWETPDAFSLLERADPSGRETENVHGFVKKNAPWLKCPEGNWFQWQEKAVQPKAAENAAEG